MSKQPIPDLSTFYYWENFNYVLGYVKKQYQTFAFQILVANWVVSMEAVGKPEYEKLNLYQGLLTQVGFRGPW